MLNNDRYISWFSFPSFCYCECGCIYTALQLWFHSRQSREENWYLSYPWTNESARSVFTNYVKRNRSKYSTIITLSARQSPNGRQLKVAWLACKPRLLVLFQILFYVPIYSQMQKPRNLSKIGSCASVCINNRFWYHERTSSPWSCTRTFNFLKLQVHIHWVAPTVHTNTIVKTSFFCSSGI